MNSWLRRAARKHRTQTACAAWRRAERLDTGPPWRAQPRTTDVPVAIRHVHLVPKPAVPHTAPRSTERGVAQAPGTRSPQSPQSRNHLRMTHEHHDLSRTKSSQQRSVTVTKSEHKTNSRAFTHQAHSARERRQARTASHPARTALMAARAPARDRPPRTRRRSRRGRATRRQARSCGQLAHHARTAPAPPWATRASPFQARHAPVTVVSSTPCGRSERRGTRTCNARATTGAMLRRRARARGRSADRATPERQPTVATERFVRGTKKTRRRPTRVTASHAARPVAYLSAAVAAARQRCHGIAVSWPALPTAAPRLPQTMQAHASPPDAAR